ncbi:hypothetical protein Mp_1g00020 [Marchantia polymorpha subsp. ruderalis]|uniref:Uncharacterized protein n=1 Tax=Marchantia polymorpha subsp. ruderalis TaxID=1480154 RepID=A0AAF6AJT3_MARPO|nr:hypothetical protein Mp_1g00020 [Marchantia polymorpha subsp. ruderalis]
MRVKVNPACTPLRPLSWGVGRGARPEAEIRVLFGPLGASTEKTGNVARGRWRGELQLSPLLLLPGNTALTSDQARLPAEFKHITKRRKRN